MPPCWQNKLTDAEAAMITALGFMMRHCENLFVPPVIGDLMDAEAAMITALGFMMRHCETFMCRPVGELVPTFEAMPRRQ